MISPARFPAHVSWTCGSGSVKNFEKHLIFYLERNEGIEVVPVLRTARNIETILEQEE